MDSSQAKRMMRRSLTRMCLEYEDTLQRLKELEEAIKSTALQVLDESEVFGNVELKPYSSSVRYDYKAAGEDAPEEIVEANTKMYPRTSWKGVVEAMGINKELLPQTEIPAHVKVKVI